MRKIVFVLVLMSACLFATSSVFAQDAKLLGKQKGAAKSYITATNSVIKNAINAKKNNKKATDKDGPLIAKAFDHQKHAMDLFGKEKYEKAIYHSLKARRLAAYAIKVNKGDFNETADPENVFKDFKDAKDKENKAFYKNMKKAFKPGKETTIGEFEGELDQNIEVTEDDTKVDPKALVPLK